MKDADLPTPVSNSGTQEEQPPKKMIRFTSPPPDANNYDRPAYRRRYGRGGRLFVEERKSRPFVVSKPVVCDSDDESDDETVVHVYDPYQALGLNYRAALLASRPKTDPEHTLRRTGSSGDIAMGNGQNTAGQTPGRPQ